MGCDDLSLIISTLSLLVTCLALYLAWRIPHQVMVNQSYSTLVSIYNSYEMGEAIRAIFDFYEYCCGNDPDAIAERYKNRYYTDFPEQAEKDASKCPLLAEGSQQKNCLDCQRYGNKHKPEYKDTLHAKRRLIDQYFWFIGNLVFGEDYRVHLPESMLRHWFTKNERRLLAVILEMDRAEEKIWEEKPKEEIPEKDYSANKGLMWPIRKRLFAESKHWK
jgi:hypothetical protein